MFRLLHRYPHLRKSKKHLERRVGQIHDMRGLRSLLGLQEREVESMRRGRIGLTCLFVVTVRGGYCKWDL